MKDEACVSELIGQLCAEAKDTTVARRQVALRLLLVLCRDGEADLQDHTHMLIGFFLNALNDPDETATELAWDTLAAVVKVTHSQSSAIASCLTAICVAGPPQRSPTRA